MAGSREFIQRIHRFRKMVGGGMRQVGFLAAAGIYALDHHIDRDGRRPPEGQEDGPRTGRHQNIIIHPEEVETNILFFDVSPSERTAHEVAAAVREKGVRVHPTSKTRIRCVAHLDVSFADIDRALEVIAGVMKR